MHHRKFVKAIKNYKINFVVKVLIFSDVVGFFATNLSGPIFAIFISQNFTGATLETVGISSAIFFIVKSILEIPFGVYVSRTKTERDDLYLVIFGILLISGVFFSYLIINTVWQLYFSQVILGIASAMAYPGWYSIFVRHLDKNKEAVEWSIYDISVGIGMAISAVIGGFIAEKLGFDWVFFVSGIILLISGFSLFLIKNKIYKN